MSRLGRRFQQSPTVAAALAREADKHARRLHEAEEVFQEAIRAVERMLTWQRKIVVGQTGQRRGAEVGD